MVYKAAALQTYYLQSAESDSDVQLLQTVLYQKFSGWDLQWFPRKPNGYLAEWQPEFLHLLHLAVQMYRKSQAS